MNTKQKAKRLAAQKAAHFAANKEKIVAKAKARYQTDIQFRLRACLRNRICTAVKRKQTKPTRHPHILFLGCTVADLRAHIEKQFEPWMSWENYGAYGWHIDHIKPLTTFDLTDPEQVAEACHYTNLRPLHWRENIVRGQRVRKKRINNAT